VVRLRYCFFSVLLEAAAPFDPEVEPLAAVEPLSCFAGSDEDALDEDDGALVEPLELGEVLSEPLALLEPPAALSFFSVEEAALDEEDGGVAVELDVELSFFFDASIETELDVEPAAGDDGVVVPAVEEDAEPDGVVVVLETARSPSRSQPVSMPAPSARETATAKVVSFMSAMSSVGWGKARGARLGPDTLRP